MTELDDKILPKVKALIIRVGRTYTITDPPAPSDFDPTTGVITGTPATYAPIGTPILEKVLNYEKGSTAKVSSGVVYFAGQDILFTPQRGQKIAFDGETHHIHTWTPTSSGVSNALWKAEFGNAS